MEDPECDNEYIEGRDKSQHGRPLTPYYSAEDLEFLAKCKRALVQLRRIKTKELAKQQQGPDYNHDPNTCRIEQCWICH